MQASNYFAFRVTPQREEKAHKLFTDRGFTSLFAHEVKEIQKRKHTQYQKVKKIYPLLHGYALLQHDGSYDWWGRAFEVRWPYTDDRVLRSALGVQGAPYPIPQASINHLLARSGKFHPLPTDKQVRIGDRVKITKGAFMGSASTVDSLIDKNARMLLGFMGGKVEALVPIDILEVVAV